MVTMIRAWLRRWLYVDGIDKAVDELQAKIASQDQLIASAMREIEALKYMRTQREAKAHTRKSSDWETVQAEYAANPDNFKEN